MENGKKRKKHKRADRRSSSAAEKMFFPAGLQPYETADHFGTDIITGLSSSQAKKARSGSSINVLHSEFHLSFKGSLKKQIRNITGIFLACVCVLVCFFDFSPALLVLAGVEVFLFFFNAFLEYRASGALKISRSFSSLKTTLLRDGITTAADSRILVPGDVILLEAGMVVPADCRIVEDYGLHVLETPVSGTAGSVLKDSDLLYDIEENIVVHGNMVYAGTIVTSGTATAIVCFTGKDTLYRKIYGEGAAEKTPDVLAYVSKVSKLSTVFSFIACFVMLFFGVLMGRDITYMFVLSLAAGGTAMRDTAEALAAAALFAGAKKAINTGSVIRNFDALPAICSLDTIMCSKSMAFPPYRMLVRGCGSLDGYRDAEYKLDEKTKELLLMSLACSDIKIMPSHKKPKVGESRFSGRVQDVAAAEYLQDNGVDVAEQIGDYFRLDAERDEKGEIIRVIVLHKGKNYIILKGTPEHILSRCDGYEQEGKKYRLDPAVQRKIKASFQESAGESGVLSAIATAVCESDSLRSIYAERNLIYKGYISFYSMVEVENSAAVYKCRQAGIDTLVNSPDSFYTSYQMCKKAGITDSEEELISASEMHAMDESLFDVTCEKYKVFLDFLPGDWLKVLELRKAKGHTVGVSAQTHEELPVMIKADSTFAPETAPDTIKQSTDILLLRTGFDNLTACLVNIKTLYLRIFSVSEYLSVGMLTLFIAAFISLALGVEIPFRLQEVVIGGFVINFLFAVSLALFPGHRKILEEKTPRFGRNPSPKHFLNQLVYSFVSAICMSVLFSLTGFSASLIFYAASLYFYCFTSVFESSVMNKKAAKNPFLHLSAGISVGLVTFLCFYRPAGDKLGIDTVTPMDIWICFLFAAGMFLVFKLWAIAAEQRRKKKKHKFELYMQEDLTSDADDSSGFLARRLFEEEDDEDDNQNDNDNEGKQITFFD